MEQEYTTSTGYKIFYGAIAAALIAFTFFISLVNNEGYRQTPGLILFPVLGIAGAALIIINLVKRKVTISDYSVTRTNVWGTKELINKDIKGFRIGDKAIFIYPIDESSSKLSITDYLSIGDDKGLKESLSSRFRDLDKEEFEEAKQEILKDESLGVNAEDRELRFNTNRKYTMWYSIAGIFSLTLSIIFHTDSPIVSVILLIYPLIGLLLMAYSKGLIRLFAKKNSAYASIFMGILFPALALAIQATINTQILNYNKLWWPVAIVALLIFIVLYFITLKNVSDKILPQLIFALIFAVVYGIGSVAGINRNFDQSKAQVFPVTVINHYIYHGKSTTYHITISEWRENHSSENVSVTSSFYDNAPVGSKVNVNLKQGVFNVPWYYITQ